MHTFISFKARSTPWLLLLAFKQPEFFRSLTRPDKCVRSTLSQSDRLYYSRATKQDKVKSNDASQLTNVVITLKGDIITTSLLSRLNLQEVTDASNTIDL